MCLTRAKLASLTPVLLSVFSLVPDLLFDCSRVLEYAKIRTVLQSSANQERTIVLLSVNKRTEKSKIARYSTF